MLCESNSTQGNAEPLIGSYQVLCESNSPRKTKASAKCEALRHFLLENQMSYSSHASYTSYRQMAKREAHRTHPPATPNPPTNKKGTKHETESKLERACASALGCGTPPLNQAELRDGRKGVARDAQNGEAAFGAHEPTRGLARRANPCERIPTDRAHRRASHEREGPENTFPPITMRSEPPMRSASRARSARTIAIRDVNPPKPHPYP